MPKHYYTPEEAAALPPWVRELTLKDERGYYVETPEQHRVELFIYESIGVSTEMFEMIESNNAAARLRDQLGDAHGCPSLEPSPVRRDEEQDAGAEPHPPVHGSDGGK